MLFGNRKKKILVADDNEDFLRVMEAILEHAGYTIDTADDGEEALKAIKKREYDLLVLDTAMPRIDGIRLCQLTRKSKRYASIRVLLVHNSNDAESMTEQEMKQLEQADGLIHKPIKTKAFLEKVREIIG